MRSTARERCFETKRTDERYTITKPLLPNGIVDFLLVGKWSYDCYYRCCYRGKNGGVGIRSKCNIASPLVGCIPLGRVFRASCAIYNELGDAMVKIDPLSCPDLIAEKKAREGWIPCRSIRNEIFIEAHSGPWRNAHAYYRCVIEGCKVRAAPDLSLSEIGYVLYGDVLQVIECTVCVDGIAMLRLHDQYFDGPAWVVERTLDNESVLNRVENPFAPNTKSLSYRCVQDNGAPLRTEPSLNSPPISRLPCGAVVSIVERLITPERQVFLRLARITSHNVEDTDLWVIETSTVCASVMVPCRDSCIVNSTII